LISRDFALCTSGITQPAPGEPVLASGYID